MKIGGRQKIKMITHLVGDGKITVMDAVEKFIAAEDLDPAVFVETHIERFIEHGERSYRYLDCVKESFTEKNEKRHVFYVRYRLDGEKENFKDFVKAIKPGDFMLNM